MSMSSPPRLLNRCFNHQLMTLSTYPQNMLENPQNPQLPDERAYLRYQGQLTDMLCIMTDQLAALSTPDSLFIPVSFPTHPSHSATGLVDSSSMHCFIDTQFANKLGLF